MPDIFKVLMRETPIENIESMREQVLRLSEKVYSLVLLEQKLMMRVGVRYIQSRRWIIKRYE